MNQIETDHRLRMANVGARLTMAMATFGISVEDAGHRTGYPALKVLSIVTGQPDVTLLEYTNFAAALGCRINVDVVAIETTSAPVQQSAPAEPVPSTPPTPEPPKALLAETSDRPAITPERLSNITDLTRGDRVLAAV